MMLLIQVLEKMACRNCTRGEKNYELLCSIQKLRAWHHIGCFADGAPDADLEVLQQLILFGRKLNPLCHNALDALEKSWVHLEQRTLPKK